MLKQVAIYLSLAISAFFFAKATYMLLRPIPDPPKWSQEIALQTIVKKDIPLKEKQIQEIMNRNLLGAENLPPIKQNISEQVQNTTTAEIEVNFELEGTVESDTAENRRAIIHYDKKTKLYKLGDKIKGWMVTGIGYREVELKKGEQNKTIKIDKN